MAKVVKDTREVMNVEEELNKVNGKSSKTKKAEKTKSKKTESTKKKDSKKTVKTKKHSKIVTFFKEVKKEVSKVKWPSKKEMVKYSVATIVFILFFGVFFYVIDLIIALLKAGV